MTRFRALVAVVALAPVFARADDDLRKFPDPTGPAYTITSRGDRSLDNKLMLGGIAGAGAVLGAIGLYFNLDSQSAADSVSALQPKNRPWSQADQDAYDRAGSSGTKATVFYALGGAAVLGAIVAFIITEPPTTTTTIVPHRASIAPTPGGAIIGGAWSF